MVCAEGWWDCGWQRRRALAIDTSVGGESLTDVPLFVGIDPQNTTLQALGGVDYRLVDDAGDVLDHELVVDAQGQVIGIWFRLPTYGDGAPTVRLYYENAEAEDGQNPAGVWQNGYVGVWHLDGTLAESITGTPITVEDATLVDGVTGSAYSFDGMTGAVVAPLDPNLDDVFSSGGSVEAWFRSVDAGQNGFGRIVDKGGGPPTTAGFGLYLEGASDPRLRMSRGIESGAKFYNSATGVLTHGAWTHICLSYDDSDIEVAPVVEADGEPLTMTVANALMGATVTDAMHSLFIGNAETRNRTFHGELDEIRVSRTVRSEAWGRVQALGSRGMLVTVGDDELQG
jgi:hypothetical protein